ncbi:hypothetical protein [Actinomadura macrotermitis]|uniref:CopG family transcriptional regulator n=1 Tax=Actinomadura macrotermitis TaxID=2585200 RepID=A0A7K0C2H5_9ACTN|nr:hypothetical protein [Actinomadura macrotermitis]MQY07034.1 hypothetical protein [Actinomadura macrotermitis]
MTKPGALPDERVENPPKPRDAGGRSGGARITVNLTAKANAALTEAADKSGDIKTDVVNRALIIYAYLEEIQRTGGKVMIQRAGEDVPEVIHFV